MLRWRADSNESRTSKLGHAGHHTVMTAHNQDDEKSDNIFLALPPSFYALPSCPQGFSRVAQVGSREEGCN